jgi:hypothetical protein
MVVQVCFLSNDYILIIATDVLFHINRSKISWPLSGSKTNLAEAYQDNTPATQLKSTTNVMALRTKIQTFSRKQDFNIRMHIKADLDVWNSTMGMC